MGRLWPAKTAAETYLQKETVDILFLTASCKLLIVDVHANQPYQAVLINSRMGIGFTVWLAWHEYVHLLTILDLVVEQWLNYNSFFCMELLVVLLCSWSWSVFGGVLFAACPSQVAGMQWRPETWQKLRERLFCPQVPGTQGHQACMPLFPIYPNLLHGH